MTPHPLCIVIMNRQYGGTVGGVERTSIRLANEMAERGHQVHIISLDLADAQMSFDLDGRVQWHRIAASNAKNKAGWKERIARLAKIHSILKNHKINVAIGFQDGAYLSLRLGAICSGVPVIAAERNAPSRFDFLKSKIARTVVFNIFRFARRITVQCPSYVDQYPAFLRHKIVTIPNVVDEAHSIADAEGSNAKIKEILFVGRLDYQKNVATLVSAFGKIHADFPDWRLRLVGGGPQEDSLKSLAATLNVTNAVIFEGMQKNVEQYYTQAHLFCLPSLWEGFPNALGEAMAHGLPSVGFKNCSGVCDLIEHDRTGLLVEGSPRDFLPLSESLSKMMASAALRKTIGDASREAMNAYRGDKVFRMWEDLFRTVAKD